MSYLDDPTINSDLIIDAVNLLEAEVTATIEAIETGTTTSHAVAASIHGSLPALAVRASQTIDRGLALDVCRQLGRTLGHASVDSGRERRECDAYLYEQIDDLDATIEMIYVEDMLELSRGGLPRVLGSAAACTLEDVAYGEHHGDLFVATGSAVAIAACLR
jgi:hypothetical protein